MRTNRGQLFAVIIAAFGFAGTRSFGEAAKADAEHVECKDGTISKKGQGACSGHGGVAANVNTSAANPTSVPESATVLCKDGTSSKKGKGACSGHGGVAQPMTPSGSSSSASQKGTGEMTPSGASSGASQKGTGGSSSDARANQKSTGTPVPNAPDTSSSSGSRTTAPGAAASPTPSTNKSGKPTARCKDGTLSYSAQHEGACSHHGGVDQWLDQKQ